MSDRPAPPPADLSALPARGPASAWVLGVLRDGHAGPAPATNGWDGLGDDVQLALYLATEQHFGPLHRGPGRPAAVDAWDPALVGFRRDLERCFEATLRDRIGSPGPCGDPLGTLRTLIDADTGPSVSRHVETEASLDQLRDVVVHRSPYQLKEGDAHTIGIAHLRGDAKQQLVRIQAGEYGADAPDRAMHAELFAGTMRALGLDDRPNAHLAAIPAGGLAVSNLVSMFGLDHRWRSALVGHLAVFEMTSVEPMGRYARGLRRLGLGPDARRFYEVHVLADAEHEEIAAGMVRAQAAAEPELAGDIVFGAQCVLEVERCFADALFDHWRRTGTPSSRAGGLAA